MFRSFKQPSKLQKTTLSHHSLFKNSTSLSHFSKKSTNFLRSFSSEPIQEPFKRTENVKKEYMREISNEEQILNIILNCAQGQVSTRNPFDTNKTDIEDENEDVFSSILPYSMKSRQHPLKEFFLVANKSSSHEKNYEENNLDGYFSMAIGHNQPNAKMLLQINRLPPRVALYGNLEKITEPAEAFTIWQQHFQTHENVRRDLNETSVTLFRVKEFKSAYLMDLQNQMQGVYDLEKLIHDTDPDPLNIDRVSSEVLLRLNRRPKALKLICRVFGQNVSDAICLSVDRYGLDVLALPQGSPVNVPEEWVKLRLYYEQEITDGKTLFAFIFSLDPKLRKLL